MQWVSALVIKDGHKTCMCMHVSACFGWGHPHNPSCRLKSVLAWLLDQTTAVPCDQCFEVCMHHCTCIAHALHMH